MEWLPHEFAQSIFSFSLFPWRIFFWEKAWSHASLFDSIFVGVPIKIHLPQFSLLQFSKNQFRTPSFISFFSIIAIPRINLARWRISTFSWYIILSGIDLMLREKKKVGHFRFFVFAMNDCQLNFGAPHGLSWEQQAMMHGELNVSNRRSYPKLASRKHTERQLQICKFWLLKAASQLIWKFLVILVGRLEKLITKPMFLAAGSLTGRRWDQAFVQRRFWFVLGLWIYAYDDYWSPVYFGLIIQRAGTAKFRAFPYLDDSKWFGTNILGSFLT